MKMYKPGDIIIFKGNHSEIFLVLEVDSEKELCMVYTLSHNRKKFVGTKLNLWFYNSQSFTLLKDKKLNEI